MSKRRWPSDADDRLRELYLAGMSTAHIADLLGRSETAVKQHVRKIGLHRKKAGAKHWTETEMVELRRRYPDELSADLARHFNCNVEAVFAKANSLGLHKSEIGKARMAEVSRQHALTDPRMIATRIKPGATPPNKGLRRPGWAPGRMRETQFKKGRPANEARNYQPIGTLRINRGKHPYLEKKITDDPSLTPALRWRAVARLVWEEANGAVPAGHAVVFMQGRDTLVEAEITVDGLELITRAELMKRNSYHNRYPKEIGLAIQLRGALMRRINRLSSGESHAEQDR